MAVAYARTRLSTAEDPNTSDKYKCRVFGLLCSEYSYTKVSKLSGLSGLVKDPASANSSANLYRLICAGLYNGWYSPTPAFKDVEQKARLNPKAVYDSFKKDKDYTDVVAFTKKILAA